MLCDYPLSVAADANNKPNQSAMKTTQYAVKYQLSANHTGRVHDAFPELIADLKHCQAAATSGLGDEQGISVVAVEGDGWRNLTEIEMDRFAKLAFCLGVEC